MQYEGLRFSANPILMLLSTQRGEDYIARLTNKYWLTSLNGQREYNVDAVVGRNLAESLRRD